MPNAIEVLTEEHRQAEQMLQEIKQTRGEDTELLMTAKQELEVHMRVEEEVLYPFIRREVPEGDSLMNEAEEEHKEARAALKKVEAAAPGTEEFMQALTELEGGIKHHVQEEETEVFPKLRQTVDEQKLEQFGQELLQAKQRFMDTASTEGMTRDELYAEAKEIGIEGRSKMNKDELAEAVAEEQQA